MNAPSTLLRTCLRTKSCASRASVFYSQSQYKFQSYSTHRETVNLDTGTSSLSQSLDTKRHSSTRRDSAGPFQLGVSQQALRSGEKVKKWSELSTGGKVVRSAAQTKNLAVILVGAGLATLLIYTITSEMYSHNSPTNLYKDACERIQTNTRVLNYLNGPLTFHNNPPSLVRPRHRNRHVTSQVFVDAHGQEHMIMTFFIQGRPEGAAPLPSEIGYFASVSHWLQETAAHIPDVTLNEVTAWSRDKVESLWERSKKTFKYLSGAPVIPPTLPSTPEHEKPTQEEGKRWNVTGIFSSLKGSRGVGEEVSRVDHRSFTEGEVHADLVRNEDGYFVFRYLLVDIPSTRDSNPTRVFVERAPGVRQNEPVMRWTTH